MRLSSAQAGCCDLDAAGGSPVALCPMLYGWGACHTQAYAGVFRARCCAVHESLHSVQHRNVSGSACGAVRGAYTVGLVAVLGKCSAVVQTSRWFRAFCASAQIRPRPVSGPGFLGHPLGKCSAVQMLFRAASLVCCLGLLHLYCCAVCCRPSPAGLQAAVSGLPT